MIYLTGDTHAEFKHRFNVDNFPEQREMTKDDYVIICGDFGGIWDANEESKSEKYWLDWFEERSYTLLFIDGNHESGMAEGFMRSDKMCFILCAGRFLR